MESKNWVALKFGGTSVSTIKNWKQIVRRAIQLRDEEGVRVWIVISALTNVTNRLIASIDEWGQVFFFARLTKSSIRALKLRDDQDFESENLDWIRDRHQQLADEVFFLRRNI